MMVYSFGRLVVSLFLLLALLVPASQSRGLQERVLHNHEFELSITYGFEFNTTAPETISVEETDDILRLTEIFFRRVLASGFSRSYQNTALSYKSHDWQAENGVLEIKYDTLVVFREVEFVITPTGEQALDAMMAADTESYINLFVVRAQPEDIFPWATTATIGVTAKSTTSAVVTAPTRAPSNTSPLNDLMVSPQTSGSPLNDLMVPPQSSSNVADSEGATSPPQTGENMNMPESMGGPFDVFSSTQSSDLDKAYTTMVTTTTSDDLTAVNMFYWMVAVRVIYYVISAALSQWSRTFKASDKKFALTSYWVHVVTQLPLLAVLVGVILGFQGDDSEIVRGLRAFSHAAMLLLSIYGIDVFLRAHEMNKVLIALRVVFGAAILYVLQEESSGMNDPLDLYMFGAIEAIGACADLPSQIGMIQYRFWADSPLEVQDRLRPRVALVMQLCLGVVFLAKLSFLLVSVLWYVFTLPDLSSTNLVWIFPLVRILQAPLLVRSFHLQLLVYNQVASTPQHDEILTKEVVVDNSSTGNNEDVQL